MKIANVGVSQAVTMAPQPPSTAVVPVRVPSPTLQQLPDCRTDLVITPSRLNFDKIKLDISSPAADSRTAAKLLLMQALRWVSLK